MNREELLRELTIERFGPIPRTRRKRPTLAEVTEFEAAMESRVTARRRRQMVEAFGLRTDDYPRRADADGDQ